MKIIVDAFGGDNAPAEIIKGCALALEEQDDIEIILTGPKDKIEAAASENNVDISKMQIENCSDFLTMEDEAMVDQFLTKHPDLSLLPIEKVGGMEDGHPEWCESKRAEIVYTARFWPHKVEGQGHFAALIQRAGDKKPREIESVDRRGGFSADDLLLFETWCRESLTRDWREILPKDGYLQKLGTSLYYSPVPQGALASLRVLRDGILLGELKKDRFEPSQALAMTLSKGDVKREVDLADGDERCVRYLKGETLTGEFQDGWTMILTDGFPLGWAKASQGKLKNKYLKGWLM